MNGRSDKQEWPGDGTAEEEYGRSRDERHEVKERWEKEVTERWVSEREQQKERTGRVKSLRLPHLPSLPVCCLPPSLSWADDERGLSVAQSTKQQKQGLKGDMAWTWSVHSPSLPTPDCASVDLSKTLLDAALAVIGLSYLFFSAAARKEWRKHSSERTSKSKAEGGKVGSHYLQRQTGYFGTESKVATKQEALLEEMEHLTCTHQTRKGAAAARCTELVVHCTSWKGHLQLS